MTGLRSPGEFRHRIGIAAQISWILGSHSSHCITHTMGFWSVYQHLQVCQHLRCLQEIVLVHEALHGLELHSLSECLSLRTSAHPIHSSQALPLGVYHTKQSVGSQKWRLLSCGPVLMGWTPHPVSRSVLGHPTWCQKLAMFCDLTIIWGSFLIIVCGLRLILYCWFGGLMG